MYLEIKNFCLCHACNTANNQSNLSSYTTMNNNSRSEDSKITNKPSKRFLNYPQFSCFNFFRKKLFSPKLNAVVSNMLYIKENTNDIIITSDNNNSDSTSNHNHLGAFNGDGDGKLMEDGNTLNERTVSELFLKEMENIGGVEKSKTDELCIVELDSTNPRLLISDFNEHSIMELYDKAETRNKLNKPNTTNEIITKLKEHEAEIYTLEPDETIITDLETNETIITAITLPHHITAVEKTIEKSNNIITVILEPILMSPVANKYYQQNEALIIPKPQKPHQNYQSTEDSNRQNSGISSNNNSNSASRGSSSNKSLYNNKNSNNSNSNIAIDKDSNFSDVSTESDSDNSSPTRVIGSNDAVINVNKIENLTLSKSPLSIARPHSVLGSNDNTNSNNNIAGFERNKRPKTANVINFDDIPIKSRSISIENIPLTAEITSIKSAKLSIENIPFDEIPIKSKTSSLENISNISRSSSIIHDQFHRLESPTPHDVDDISSNSVGTRSDTDYEDDTTNTKSKTEMSETFTPKSNRTSKSYNSTDLNSDKSEYNEMGDDDFIKPTIKSPQRKLKSVIFRSKKVAPAKSSLSRKSTKQQNAETYTLTSLARRIERPRDALNQCIIQLESQNWEITMSGINIFVRLMRHHPEHVEAQIHHLAANLAKHVKNLRSQVARAACQAAGEFFATHRKYLDQETEDLVTNLLHRTADTNKFLRADAGRALDSMVDNLHHSKVIHIISIRGIAHPNAVVRTSAAKLLDRLVSRLGCDKIFAMNKECRDKLILNTAQLLQEGSLETRNYAKDIFKQLSGHHSYSKVLFDVIPQRIYRNIEKTLKNIK